MRTAIRHASLSAASFVFLVSFVLGACGDDSDATRSEVGTTAVSGASDERSTCADQSDCVAARVCSDNRCLSVCASTTDCAADEFCGQRGLCRPLACEVQEDCDALEVCADGTCVLGSDVECTPNVRTCDAEGRVVICTSTGEISERRACPADAVCQQDDTDAFCVTQVCVPGERTCAAVDTVGVCTESGNDVDLVPCGAGEYCDEGECLQQVCDTAAPLRCEGTEIIGCSPVGDREYRVVDCGDAGCSNGACDGELADGCTPGDSFRCYGGDEPPEERGECNYGARVCGDDGRFGNCEGWTTPAEESCPDEALSCLIDTPERVFLDSSAADYLASSLRDENLTVGRGSLLSTSDLDDYDVIVARAVLATFDAARLQEWVREKGGMLILFGGDSDGDCALANRSLGALGFRYDCASPFAGGIDELGTHPLTEGMDADALATGPGPAPIILDAARAVVLAQGPGGTFAAVAERDCGQVALFASSAPLREPTTEGEERFLDNMVGWIAP